MCHSTRNGIHVYFNRSNNNIRDPSARNESHVGSVQVEKIGNMHDMG